MQKLPDVHGLDVEHCPVDGPGVDGPGADGPEPEPHVLHVTGHDVKKSSWPPVMAKTSLHVLILPEATWSAMTEHVMLRPALAE